MADGKESKKALQNCKSKDKSKNSSFLPREIVSIQFLEKLWLIGKIIFIFSVLIGFAVTFPYLLSIHMNIGQINLWDLYTLICISIVFMFLYVGLIFVVYQMSLPLTYWRVRRKEGLEYVDLFTQKTKLEKNSLLIAKITWCFFITFVVLTVIVTFVLKKSFSHILFSIIIIFGLVFIVSLFSTNEMKNQPLCEGYCSRLCVFTALSLLIVYFYFSEFHLPLKLYGSQQEGASLVVKRNELMPLINSAKYKENAILKKHLDCSDNSQFCTLVSVDILFQGIGSNTKIRVPLLKDRDIVVTLPNSSIIAIYDAPIKAHNKTDTHKDKQ